MKIVDQFHDPSLTTLARLVLDRPKVASVISEVEVDPDISDSLPDTAFAWSEKRAFPITSREHTIMSRLYRENTPKVPEHVDRALKEASEVYGVDEALFAREKRASAPVKENLDDYLLPDLKQLQVKTAADVKIAEQQLLQQYKRLSVEHRAMACRRLMDKAAEHNVALNPLMHKLAGFTVTSTDTMRRWIEARAEAASDTYKEAFQKLAAATKKLPAEIRDRNTQVKFAEALTELDKVAGLIKHYDRKLPDPMMSVFNTSKVSGDGVDLNGKFVSMTRLAAYPSSFYGDILGDDLVREASDGRGGMDPHKLAAILETLPRDMKGMLGKQMR